TLRVVTPSRGQRLQPGEAGSAAFWTATPLSSTLATWKGSVYDPPMPAKPVTDPFVLHACELLSGVGPCVAKRMFGGWGISTDGMNIGLIAWDTLYLKTNATTEPV